jgi:hypothetical protein
MDELYLRIRGKLLDDFRPSEFTDRAQVDLLAREYATLVRITRMEKALFRVPLGDDDLVRWRKITERRQHLEQLDALLSELKAGQSTDCDQDEAQAVANLLAQTVEVVAGEAAEIRETRAERKASGIKAADDKGICLELDDKLLALDRMITAPGLNLGNAPSVSRVLTGRGRLYCHDKQSHPLIKRKTSYIGHETNRGTVKYRCMARHEGLEFQSDSECNGCSSYGKTVRVKCDNRPAAVSAAAPGDAGVRSHGPVDQRFG